MHVSASPLEPGECEADTVAVGVFEGEGAPAGAPAEVAELLSSGEARTSAKAIAVTHAGGRRWLLVGLGERARFDPERARVAAAVAAERAREISTRCSAGSFPAEGDAAIAGALVEGTLLRDYRYERSKSAPADAGGSGGRRAEGPRGSDRLGIGRGRRRRGRGRRTRAARGRCEQRADLQNRPGNDLTPAALGDYARELAAGIDGLSVEVEGRAGILARGMGAFAAVAQGSEQEPALITLSYDGAGGDAEAGAQPTLAFVGKAVTFDSGGISLKPGAKMAEMKFDMSGGAAVIEAAAAIARLGLPVRLLAVVGATENLPSGRAIKPGDIVVAANGKTIEVNNTDAEGRLVLADCLAHAVAAAPSGSSTWRRSPGP